MTRPPSKTQQTLTLWRAQRGLARELFAIARDAAAEVDLGTTQAEVVLLLMEFGPMMMHDLAGGLGVAPSSATRTIGQMVRDGLIERRLHPSDRRRVELSLRPVGLEKADELASVGFTKAWQAVDELVAGGVEPEVLERAEAILKARRERNEAQND